MLPVTDAGQLGDLGVLNLKMPDNGFLYVYVSNESSETVDFDNLTIIHKGGRYLEENHYYPYGMLIEGLSYHSRTNPSESKFNGDWYEGGNNLYDYFTPYRSYDPAIERWNQIDPLHENANGYFAFGGNPVSYTTYI